MFDLLTSLLARASSLFYDNSGSKIPAENVQDAIDYIVSTGAGQPFTSLTDPALNAITQSIIDDNGGVVITLTAAGNDQTLPTPTDTSITHKFTVINNDTSTDNIDIIGATTVTLQPGEKSEFVYDGTAWIVSEAEGLWLDDGSNLKAQSSTRNIDVQTGKFTAGSNTEISEVSNDTLIENTSATNNIDIKLGEDLGVTKYRLLNATGTVVAEFDSIGSLLAAIGQTSVLSITNSSDVEKAKFNSDGNSFINGGNLGVGTANPNTTLDIQGGQTNKVTVVNAATYSLLITDYDLSVTYTATGVCDITLPSAQDYLGRTITINDDGDNSSVNKINIYDDAGTPNLLYEINGDGDGILLTWNGTEWRLR